MNMKKTTFIIIRLNPFSGFWEELMWIPPTRSPGYPSPSSLPVPSRLNFPERRCEKTAPWISFLWRGGGDCELLCYWQANNHLTCPWCPTSMLVDWLTGTLAGWLLGWLTGWVTYWMISWLSGWLTALLTDWLNERMNDLLDDWHILTGWLVVCLSVCLALPRTFVLCTWASSTSGQLYRDPEKKKYYRHENTKRKAWRVVKQRSISIIIYFCRLCWVLKKNVCTPNIKPIEKKINADRR